MAVWAACCGIRLRQPSQWLRVASRVAWPGDRNNPFNRVFLIHASARPDRFQEGELLELAAVESVASFERRFPSNSAAFWFSFLMAS